MNSRMKNAALFAVVVLSCSATAPKAHAATATANQTVTAQIDSAATLVLGSPTVTFSSLNPTGAASVASNEGAIAVTANARTASNGNVTLTVLAAGDLTTGGGSPNVIPAGAVSWTASGAGFLNGALSKTAAQTVATWTGPGRHNGTMNFALDNSFDYPSGTYSTTLTYTLATS